MPPDAEGQIQFLVHLQRLLAEGQFVATYKFALLLALADISVEGGDDSGAPLKITTSQIAEKFIQYYWRQSVPYGGSLVLQQNTGKQAAIIRALEQAHSQYGHSLVAAMRRSEARRKLHQRVAQVVKVMPLWKLQTIGQGQVDFLYENVGRGDSIVLRAGVAYCFRKFYDLISDLIRAAWTRNVRQQNLGVLGEATDLGEFLFGSERANLASVRSMLLDLQAGRCFYCDHALKQDAAAVDHFISWARYPADLGHNFVLADQTCNARKSDRLAASEYLSAWAERNQKYGGELIAGFNQRNIPHDLRVSLSVTFWAYAQAEGTNGLTWMRGDELVPLGREWRLCLDRLSK